MSALAHEIHDKCVPDLDVTKDFEKELCDNRFNHLLPKIKKCIRNYVSRQDRLVLYGMMDGTLDVSCQAQLRAIGQMLRTFMYAHPCRLNLITTNYDQIVEYVASKRGFHFTDGTSFAQLSDFNIGRFGKSKVLNVIKVHGSLSWFNIDHDVRCYHGNDTEGMDPCIIIPGKDKYHEAMQRPYRELIQYADTAIGEAEAFLAIGFGFHDDHITPEIIKKANEGAPVVVVSKVVSKECRRLLKNACRIVYIEEDSVNPEASIVSIQAGNGTVDKKFSIEGAYWSLPKFMEIFHDR